MIMMALFGFGGFGRGKIVVELFCRGTVLKIDGGGVHGGKRNRIYGTR